MTDDKECFAGDDAVLDSGNSLSRPSTPSPSKLPRSWHVTVRLACTPSKTFGVPIDFILQTDASHFLDLEAAVDSEEETVMDEDEATQGEHRDNKYRRSSPIVFIDFIDDEDTGNIDPATPKAFHDDSLYHTHEDLLNEAELIRTRYGRAPIPEPDSPAEDRSLEDVLRKGKLWRVQVKVSCV